METYEDLGAISDDDLEEVKQIGNEFRRELEKGGRGQFNELVQYVKEIRRNLTLKDPDLPAREEAVPGLSGLLGGRSCDSGFRTPGHVDTGTAPDSPAGALPDRAGSGAMVQRGPYPPWTGPAPSGTREIFEQVSALLEEERYHEAENLLSRGLEIYPESVDLLKELGVLYHLQGRYGKAARTFTRVMNITGEGRQSLSWKIASLSHKASAELDGPDPGSAIASFDEILLLDPSNREALAGRIAALRLLGRLEEAERQVRDALVLEPEGASILYQEGWLNLDLDRPDLALGVFEQASRADPSWPDPVLSRAVALVRLGRGAEAAEILRTLPESMRGMPGIRAELGWFCLALHKQERAKNIFLGLAREGDPGGFHGLAAVFLTTGSTRKAGTIMERLAGAFPRDPLILANRGMVLARAGGARDLADATVSAKRALTLNPRFAPAHTCLGIIASLEGRMDEAAGHFAEAVRPSDPAGYRNLGLLACERGYWDEAEPLLLHATRIDPLDARAWAGLGAVALRRENDKEAVLLLRHAAGLDPGDSRTTHGLAIALDREGDGAGAEEVIRETLAVSREPDRWVLLLDLAALLISKAGPGGNPVLDEEARQALEKAAALRPGDPGILFYRAVADARLGHPKEATEGFTSTLGNAKYRIPALENLRRLKARRRSRASFLPGLSAARTALALFSLLQLGALWMFFIAGLLTEAAFALLVAVLSGLFALALFGPARNGKTEDDTPLDLVIPPREFIPSPGAEMVSPLIRLRTALRP
ncbi:MAG TPA: tetratricopeptide repeat protein [Methanomicrobiales archaeon]|nr:tetratricopeptide repeat protein [Methanomicrobiales archaeon]